MGLRTARRGSRRKYVVSPAPEEPEGSVMGQALRRRLKRRGISHKSAFVARAEKKICGVTRVRSISMGYCIRASSTRQRLQGRLVWGNVTFDFMVVFNKMVWLPYICLTVHRAQPLISFLNVA